MGNIYLHQSAVGGMMRVLGKAVAKGVNPVHCRVYWEDLDGRWMTELVNTEAGPKTEIVGRGDGYTIQISSVDEVLGEKMEEGDSAKLSALARSYASVAKGDLTGGNVADEREWANEPKGYGGPAYDHRITSNTYIWWLLLKAGVKLPTEPAGAVGWGHAPKFPRPK